MPPKAQLQFNSYALSHDRGQYMASHMFDFSVQEAVTKFGTYRSGPRRGKPKGYLNVWRCTRGGWKSLGPGYMNGGVIKPGTVHAWISKDRPSDPYEHIGEFKQPGKNAFKVVVPKSTDKEVAQREVNKMYEAAGIAWRVFNHAVFLSRGIQEDMEEVENQRADNRDEILADLDKYPGVFPSWR